MRCRPMILASVLALAACQPSASLPVPVVGDRVTVSGVLVSTQTGAPVYGAFINMTLVGTTLNHWETDVAGRFRIDAPFQGITPRAAIGIAPSRLASGWTPYITRTTPIRMSRSRDDVRLDVIEDLPPFSMTFYRQLARDGRDRPPGSQPIRRWTVSPSFYIRTTHVGSGAPIPPVIVSELEAMLRNSVPELTGGRFQVAAVETGPDTPPERDGWVVILLQSVLPDPAAGGQATVGGNRGTMWLQFDPASPRLAPGSGTACSWAVGAAEHEVVHTMGFYHVDAPPDAPKPLQSPDFCSGRDRPDIVRYHAAIAYSRPVGNTHPDNDPDTFLSAQAAAGPAQVVSCRFDHER